MSTASWCDNGMDRFVVLDPSHDMDAARATARIAKKAGGREVIGALTYTISAVHDDAFYAGIAAAYRDCPDIDRAYIKDPAGILTPDRARTLIPAVQAALGGKPLELHSHATLGLSQLTCLTAASARRARAPGRLRRARQRVVAAGRRAAGREPARLAGTASTSTTGCSPPSPGTSTGWPPPRGCRRDGPGRSTRRSWTTSWPAGPCRRPGGSCARSASPTGSTR